MKEMGLPGQDLLEWIVNPNTGSDRYRQATAEAIAFLVWVKRFAEAEFK
jgi:CRISPR-associated protein Cmr5